MESKKSLRYAKTRRYTGRRSITPMKSKHRKTIPKTRHHKVERKTHVPVLQHTGSQQLSERKEADKDQHSQHTKWEGNQDSHSPGERKDTQEHSQVEQVRNTENSEEPIHPGLIQTLPDLSQSEITAVDQTSDKTEIEAEELLP